MRKGVRLSHREFERLVENALRAIPEEFSELMGNVVVRIEQEPPEDMPDVLGVYEGVPLVDRSIDDMLFPDSITLYEGPLKRACGSIEELEREVRITVLHEAGHFFGLDEAQLEDLDNRTDL